MTIKEIAELITSKNFVFQLTIPGTSFSHGKTTVQMALSDSENIEGYLEKIAKANKAEHLFVKLFTKNGSSYKAKGEHLIFLPKANAVATTDSTTTPVATKETNVATTKPLNGMSEFSPTKQTPMDAKDYIDYRVLQTEHKNLQNVHDETKAKVVKLEKKIEDLHDENKSLLRDNLTKEDKHALALERAKLDIEKEGKEGLSGMMGELTKDPDTLKMLIGIFKPDHPMFKENAQPALEGASNNGLVKYSDDAVANDVLNDLPRVLSQKDGDTIARIYLLFQEFIHKPETLQQATTTFLPDYKS